MDPPSFAPVAAPTRMPTASSGYYGASAGIIITTCLFGMTICLSVLVCVRRFLLLRQLDQAIQLRYDLEAELAEAPEVTATPYVDIDVEICVNVEQQQQQQQVVDIIPPSDTIILIPSPHDKNGRPIPLYAENCEPFFDSINR